MAIEKLKYLVTADTKGFAGPIKAIGALAVTAFTAAVKVTAEFEKQLSTLRGISGATAKEMQELEKQSRSLGKSTAFTAKQVAEAQTELAKLGFTTNDILNSTGGVLDLAAGLGVELADAAKLTGATLKQFGLESEEAGRVVDVLSKATTVSALDFSKLDVALQKAGPAAKALGISLEETTALLGVVADSGIDASTAGTALRKSFIELNAQGISLNDGLKQVRESSDQLGTAVNLVGIRAAVTFLQLANGIDPSKELGAEFKNIDGFAKDLRDTMEDNLIGDFKELNSAISDLGITAGKVADGPLRSLTQLITGELNKINEVTSLDTLITKLKELDGTLSAPEKKGKDFLSVLKETLTEDGKTLIGILEQINKTYEVNDLFGKKGAGLRGENADAIIKTFKNFGVEITKADLASQNFASAYSRLITQVASSNTKLTKDSGETAANTHKKLIEGKEKELELIKLQIKLAPIQEKSELEILRLKLKQNKIEQELSIGDVKKKSLLQDEVVLNAKITAEKKKQKNLVDSQTSASFSLTALGGVGFDTSNPFDGAISGLQELGAGFRSAQGDVNGFGESFNNSFTKIAGVIDDVDLTFEEFLDKTTSGFTNLVTLIVDKAGEVIGGVINVAQTLGPAFSAIGKHIGDALAGNLEQGDTFGRALLRIIGDIAVQLGEAAIAIGVAMLAIKLSFSNPFTAIAAGIALIAVGTLIGAAGAIPQKKSTSSSSASPTGAGTFTPTRTQGSGGDSPMIVGVLRGQDLQLQLQASGRVRNQLT